MHLMGMLILMLLFGLMIVTPPWSVYVLVTVIRYIKRDRSDEQQCTIRKEKMKTSIRILICMLVILGLILLLWGGDLAEM